MNIKRFLLATLVVFIFIVFFEWIFHGIILGEMYLTSQTLWRTEEAMQAHFIWLVIGQLLFTVMFCFIFTRGYADKGWLEGLRYGVYVTLLLAGPQLILYAMQPIPRILMFYWLMGGLVEMMIAGILIALIYRR